MRDLRVTLNYFKTHNKYVNYSLDGFWVPVSLENPVYYLFVTMVYISIFLLGCAIMTR